MESKRLETAKKYISFFATLDTQALDSLLAENYTHQLTPTSLNRLAPGPVDKQGVLEHYNRLRNVMTGFPVTAKEYIENESSNRVTIWASSKTVFRDDVKDDGISQKEWIYEGEYIFLLTMDETGEKIIRIVEFLDSKAMVDKLRPLIKRANENRESRLEAEGK
jgi:ketosteroid isomerase-like protein